MVVSSTAAAAYCTPTEMALGVCAAVAAHSCFFFFNFRSAGRALCLAANSYV